MVIVLIIKIWIIFFKIQKNNVRILSNSFPKVMKNLQRPSQIDPKSFQKRNQIDRNSSFERFWRKIASRSAPGGSHSIGGLSLWAPSWPLGVPKGLPRGPQGVPKVTPKWSKRGSQIRSLLPGSSQGVPSGPRSPKGFFYFPPVPLRGLIPPQLRGSDIRDVCVWVW